MAEDQVVDSATESEQEDAAPLGPAGEKALAAMKEQLKAARAEAKAGKDAAKRLADLEASQMSEQERLTARAEQAEKAFMVLQEEHLRAQVALSKGLTDKQAKRLVGSSREELEADADDLLADLKPGKPKGDIGQGMRSDTAAQQDPRSAFASLIQNK